MEGFIGRIWRDQGVDKVALIKKGIYVVRFRFMEKRDSIFAGNTPFFGSKPMIMKPWSAEVDICKENVRTLPMWVQLFLDFKYWDMNCLVISVNPLGRLIKLDQATHRKDKLQYARLMIEVQIDQIFPDELRFINEMDILTSVTVHYEWKPIQCKICKGMGHEERQCTKEIIRKEWIPKVGIEKADGITTRGNASCWGSEQDSRKPVGPISACEEPC